MTDPKDNDTKKAGDDESPPPPVAAVVVAKTIVAPRYPPLEASARRLERLLGGGVVGQPATTTTTTSTSTPTTTTTPSSSASTVQNRSKILKKWLGSSSGSAKSATLASIATCAERSLDPSGPCATGRELLVGLADGTPGGGDSPESAAAATGEAMTDEDGVAPPPSPPSPATADYLSASAREVESWLISLAVRLAWRSGDIEVAYDLATGGMGILDAHLADTTGSSSADGGGAAVGGLHPLLARLLRYRSLAVESYPPGPRSALVAHHRPDLASRHTRAVLRRDPDVSSTVLNAMLRDLLAGDQIEQAQKLLSNATFPTEMASNNQLVRYLYYSGRVQALRLEYTLAHSNLGQALRKCPTNAGLGFRIAVQRLLVVVQLLMGEVPDRSVFFGEGMVAELRPYLEIAQAVRRGDLAVFHESVDSHADRLKADGTYSLISRLAHSVVKAGLRRLKTSYSRISLDDVATRLGLPSTTSAEFVVAKAVRDGVIDATIDHDGRYIQSHDLVDVYATIEPSEAFHRRIAYCLTTHNDAVRAMRYTPDAYKKQLEASRGLGRRGRGGDDDDKTDEEKAKEIEDEFDEDY